jgi:transcriptional regulator with XRE-family HTH domain
MKTENLFFGKKLKELRLSLNINMRDFSKEINIKPSELSKIEMGYCSLNNNLFLKIEDFLNTKVKIEDLQILSDLYKEPFVMQKMTECGYINHVTKSDGSVATPKECKDVSDAINKYAREHNLKAEVYNNQGK